MSVLTNYRLRLRALELWERNLYIMWLAQATSQMGFSFFFPFVPLFIQELGIKDPGQAALWSGIAGGASGFFMMLSGPVWGVLGDRYGRKMNVVRAMVGSAIVLGMTGIVTDVYQLVAMRMVLGLVSGTWVTVMALASSTAPRHRVPYSIGIVLSASFLGMTGGPVVGGLLADSIGYRATFIVTGALCAFAGLLVLLFVDERFQRPENQGKLGLQLVFGNLAELGRSRSLVSVMVVMVLVQLGASMLTPVLPVFVGILSASGTAAFNAGVAYSVMGLTGAVSSLAISRLTRQVGMIPVLVVACLGGAVSYLPLLVVNSLSHLYVVAGLLGVFNGGLNTLSYALVGTSVSTDKQGTAYGVAQSASSLAWGAGPLAGGAVAGLWGVREVFLANAVTLVLNGLLVLKLFGRGRGPRETDEAQLERATRPAADD